MSPPGRSGEPKSQTLIFNPKKIYTQNSSGPNVKIPQIIKKHRLKLTKDRITDFRQTMKDIVDLKNGKKIGDLMPEPGV